MGYSLRTLQRKLQSQQTTFQQQMDQVRSELAISYLQVPHVSLTDIGELLGFAELSVFSRTFRRWFGITPSQWRARRFV
jgi:AraC-like DNA-binding protein